MKKKIFVITLILIIVLSLMSLNFLNKKVSPVLFSYAQSETKRLSTIIINKAINKQLANGIDLEKLFQIVKNTDGEIQTIDFNPLVVNKILNTTTNVVLVNLKAVEEGNINFVELPDILINSKKVLYFSKIIEYYFK